LGLLVLFGAILPAEFNKDPLGLGKATGLDKLWAPMETPIQIAPLKAAPVARKYPNGFKSHVVDIPLATSGHPLRGEELEYKVEMKAGETLIYSWAVVGLSSADEFHYEFHGHTPPRPEVKVAVYEQATGAAPNGSLVAPFDGVHGWYFQNQSLTPVVVRLKISGFYALIPPGEAGNERGVLAVKAPLANP
jgi:hypothetical protein